MSIRNIGTKNKPNWCIDMSFGFNAQGKRLRVKKSGFRTQKEAERYSATYRNDVNKNKIKVDARYINFGEFIMSWFNDYKRNTLSTNTITNYLSRINTHILPYLGRYKLVDIDNIIVQDFYNNMIREGIKPSSAKKVMETLTSCFKYANKLRLISYVPTDIEKVPVQKPKIEYWTKEQLTFYLDQIKDTSLYTPILIDVMTGLRVAELCGLRWNDIDLDNGTLTVNQQIIFDRMTGLLVPTAVLKTSTSHRQITIPKLLIDHLRAIKEDIKPSPNNLVITNNYGLIYNPRNLSMNFTHSIAKYKEPIDKVKDKTNYMQLPQISFHGLRHTHATILLANGENIKILSERLGHKDITTTLNTYTHVLDESKEKTATLLDNIFDKSL